MMPATQENASSNVASVNVKCSDGVVVIADRNVAFNMCLNIRKRLEADPSATAVTIDNVTSRSFSKAMEYCVIHSTEKPANDLKQWDNQFVQVEPGVLCELASAAYHLEIKPMVDLTCYAIAQLLKGNTPEEIRRIFNIIYDFGPEDDVPPPTIRDKLRNKWIRRTNRAKNFMNSSPADLLAEAQLPPPAPPPVENPEPLPVRDRATDNRSLAQLVQFIDGGKENKAKATKKAKRKEEKKKKAQPKPESNGTNGNHQTQPTQSKRKNQNGEVTPTDSDVGTPSDEAVAADEASVVETEENETENAATDCYDGTRRSLNSSSEPITNSDEEYVDENEEEAELDPELKAMEDLEVEEFRKRLEAAEKAPAERSKITLPISLNEALFAAVKRGPG